MTPIVSIGNEKGGVGKTTTTVNLAHALSDLGMKILCIDMDKQANLTINFGVKPQELEWTIYHVLLEQVELSDILMSSTIPGVVFAPSNKSLIGAERELYLQEYWAQILSDALEPIQEKYDVILIDCPPNLGVASTNALVASQFVLVPLQCQFFALHGFVSFEETLLRIAKRRRQPYTIRIIRTMYERRTVHSRQVSQLIQQSREDLVLDTIIPRATVIADASSQKRSVLQYAKNSEAASKFRELAYTLREVINHG